ncbi:hypothetical protein RhiirA5_432229 [Rhizophagus irregularis]|uniref:Uncharacterized protein n=1 Tax=Rhizophagus irregularis TaxID=588596 RepID=A0A2N0NTP8_9GLOM|nr:hypothetical protein RhiirA5_432229 [Rhizophagus irregularis]
MSNNASFNNAPYQQPMPTNNASHNHAPYQQPMLNDSSAYNNVFYQQQMSNDTSFNNDNYSYQSSSNNAAISPNHNCQQYDASNYMYPHDNHQQSMFNNASFPPRYIIQNPPQPNIFPQANPLSITFNSTYVIIMPATNSDSQNQFQQVHTYLNNTSSTINSQTRT